MRPPEISSLFQLSLSTPGTSDPTPHWLTGWTLAWKEYEGVHLPEVPAPVHTNWANFEDTSLGVQVHELSRDRADVSKTITGQDWEGRG